MIKTNWASRSVSISGSLSHDAMAKLESMLQRDQMELVTSPENNSGLEPIQEIADFFQIDMNIESLEENGAIGPA
jgi:hypothetical protein